MAKTIEEVKSYIQSRVNCFMDSKNLYLLEADGLSRLIEASQTRQNYVTGALRGLIDPSPERERLVSEANNLSSEIFDLREKKETAIRKSKIASVLIDELLRIDLEG